MISPFLEILKYELKTTLRRKGSIVNLLVFFAIITSLFPLSLGTEQEILRSIGVGVVWVSVLFVSTLSLTRVFEEDFESGVLEQIILQPVLPSIIVLAKAVSHWISSGLPVVILSPFLIFIFGLSGKDALPLVISLALGTPILSLIGTMGAGLTLGIKRGGVLVSLLITPLYIPALIFGMGVSQSAAFGIGSEQVISNIAGLCIVFLIMLPLSVWSSAKSLRIALEE